MLARRRSEPALRSGQFPALILPPPFSSLTCSPPAPAVGRCRQVITCADFHPQQCNLFAYSSSKGLIRLGDMRQAALCDQHAKLFEDVEPAVGGVGAGARLGLADGACQHACISTKAQCLPNLLCLTPPTPPVLPSPRPPFARTAVGRGALLLQ